MISSTYTNLKGEGIIFTKEDFDNAVRMLTKEEPVPFLYGVKQLYDQKSIFSSQGACS